MNRPYWQRIQQHYPQALARCIQHFKTSSTQWRKDIQQSEKLIAFFAQSDIDLIITKARARYGYELRGAYIIIKVYREWEHRENAIWWGIDQAFYQLEQAYLGPIYRPPIRKASPRRKGTESTGPGWGAEVIKRKEEQD